MKPSICFITGTAPALTHFANSTAMPGFTLPRRMAAKRPVLSDMYPSPGSEGGMVTVQIWILEGVETGFAIATWDAGRCRSWVLAVKKHFGVSVERPMEDILDRLEQRSEQARLGGSHTPRLADLNERQ